MFGLRQIFILLPLMLFLISTAKAQVHNGDLSDECLSNLNNFEWVLSNNITQIEMFDKGYNMLDNMMDFIDWCIKNDLIRKSRLKG